MAFAAVDVDDTPLTPLVTPKNTPGRERLKSRPARGEFLDSGSKAEVCPREDFVGRRRLIQRGLRILGSVEGQEEYAEGVLLTGMGGLGKSSLAARLAIVCSISTASSSWGLWMSTRFGRNCGASFGTMQDQKCWSGKKSSSGGSVTSWMRRESPSCLSLTISRRTNKETHPIIFGLLSPVPRILQVLAAAIRETASPTRILVTSRYRFEPPRPFSLGEVPLLSMRDVELEKKLRLLQEAYPKRRKDLESRAIKAAAGNPRLLDRLYPGLADDKIDLNGILEQMENVEAAFREDVFLEKLVETQTPAVHRLLAIALLIGIPIYAEELAEILPELGNGELAQATATGLLEHFTLTKDTQWYYASPLLDAYLGGFLDHDEVAAISSLAAVGPVYNRCWAGNGLLNDDIALAIRGLALAGGEIDIAAAIVEWLCWRWIDRAAYRDVKDLCEDTLKYLEDYRVLHQLARAEEVLGDASKAEQHFRRALEILPPVRSNTPERELRGRAALLHNLAVLRLTLGNPAEAMELWQQSIDIHDQIGDVNGKAATLHNMAAVFAQQGNIERAMVLWQESLEIKDQIGTVHGKAVTLNQMAVVFAQQGEIERAMEFWQKALEIRDQIHDEGEGRYTSQHGQCLCPAGGHTEGHGNSGSSPLIFMTRSATFTGRLPRCTGWPMFLPSRGTSSGQSASRTSRWRSRARSATFRGGCHAGQHGLGCAATGSDGPGHGSPIERLLRYSPESACGLI